MWGYVELLRTHHWVKNLFVYLGVFFAGAFSTTSLLNATLAFVGFCFAASTIYIINDVVDRKSDALHPKKRSRPLPSGRVSVQGALATALLMIVLLVVSLVLMPTAAALIILGYAAINLVYTFLGKHIALLDIFFIAAGFVLRTLAGTVGIQIPASSWLLITIITLSLFLACGKRFQEKQIAKKDHKAVLQVYQAEYLEKLMIITATLSIAFYSLYIITVNATVWGLLTVPLAMFGFFYYLQKEGGDPTDVLLSDKALLITLALWTSLLLIPHLLPPISSLLL